MASANKPIYHTVGASISEVINTLAVINTSNTPSSGARETIIVGGAASGDPTLNFNISGVTNWEIGIDNSDSDNLTISQGTSLGTNDVWRMTTEGQRTMPLQSCFYATLSADMSNVTGDSTIVTVAFDNVLANQNSNYNKETGTYTAPCTGLYLFQCSVSIWNLGASHTTYTINILTSSCATRITECNPANIKAANRGSCAMSGSVLIPLTAGDIACVQIVVRGGAKTVSIDGLNFLTHFSGGLFC